MIRLPVPLAQLAVSGMNHVLRQQSAARERMRSHVGRQLRIVVAGPLGRSVHSDARVGNDGLLALTTGGTASAVITLAPTLDAVFGLLRSGAAGIGPHVKVEGDVMLAVAVAEVVRLLRWDYEEDLSRIVGDVAAHRISRGARAIREEAGGLRRRSLEALQQTTTSPDGVLTPRGDLADFASQIEQLSQRVDRLEVRVQHRLDGIRAVHARQPSVRS